jgi:hypothetical protein
VSALTTRPGIFLCSLRRRGHTRSVMQPHPCLGLPRKRQKEPYGHLWTSCSSIPGLCHTHWENAQLCFVGWSGKRQGLDARLGREPSHPRLLEGA